MSKLSDLERASKELGEVSARIEQIRHHVQNLEANLALLNSVRIQFEQNIALLKSGEVIPSVLEYRKIKEDLDTVQRRMDALRIDCNSHVSMLERANKILLELSEKYATLLRNADGRIIKGSFGGKK